MFNQKLQLALAGLFAAALMALPQPSLAAQGDCGQPVTSGANPVATDARRVLQAGVGAEPCSDTFDPCICDVNSSGAINSTDALLTLQKGVGQQVTLTCPCTGGTTTTTMSLGPQCSSAEVFAIAGSELDSGWAGPGHDQPLITGARITGQVKRRCTVGGALVGGRGIPTGPACLEDAECTGGETCELTCACDDPNSPPCEVAGPTHEKRCVVSMAPCVDDAGCAGGGGGQCVRFFGGPLPLIASDVPVCVTTFFVSEFSGTADATTGDADVAVSLRSRVHATGLPNPCPRCETGAPATVGATGTCIGDTPNVGATCTVTSVSENFGGTSPQCPPNAGTNVSGTGLSILFRSVTTGETTAIAKQICPDQQIHPQGPFGGFCADTLTGTPQSCNSNADCLRCSNDLSPCAVDGDCGSGNTCDSAPTQPIACGFYCHVGFCTAPGQAQTADAPCFADSDCPSGQTCDQGTGSSSQQNFPQRQPNGCSNSVCGATAPEQCPATDTLGSCNVLDYRSCTSNQECVSKGAGTTCNFTPKPCFENLIRRQGIPSPLQSLCSDDDPPTACTTNADCNGTACQADRSAPTLVGMFPIPASTAPAVDGAAGLTGPGSITFKQIFNVCRCGDGVTGCDETCDDGNNVSGDGCSKWCSLEP